MKTVLESQEQTFGYVKSRAPPLASPGPAQKPLSKIASGQEDSALRTDWDGEDTGTLAKVLSHRQEGANGSLLMEVAGTQRLRIIDRERSLYGFWTGCCL